MVLRHSDDVTSGIPDFSVTFARRTYWIEAKTAVRGKIKTTELQRMTMLRLGSHGHAFWLVWELTNNTLTGVALVNPAHVLKDGSYTPTWWTDLFVSAADAHTLTIKRLMEDPNENPW